MWVDGPGSPQVYGSPHHKKGQATTGHNKRVLIVPQGKQLPPRLPPARGQLHRQLHTGSCCTPQRHTGC